MPLVSLTQVSLAYGYHALLDHADFQLDAGERVGLIGRNGTGKSSLLKIIAGGIPFDDGKVWRAPDIRIGYVPQEPELNPEHSVFEAVSEGLGEVRQLLMDYHHILSKMASEPENEALLDQLHELQADLESKDGWRVQARVDTVISKLGLPEEQLVSELSGGWRKRVALARALVAAPEVLLLDEPTNHLDIPAIEWLEDLLNGFNGAVLLITHDRRFLDKVATRIVELDRGKLSSYPGRFSDYQTRKQEMLEAEATQNEKFDKLLAQEEVWIRKGIQARRTRNEGRVRRLEQLRRERAARRDRLGNISLAVEEGERSGKLVAELDHVGKSYDHKVIVKDFSIRIMRGDKIGLIGPNGAGKSTLLKLILGETKPDTGEVHQGTKLSVAYFDQLRAQLDEEKTLADTISQGSEFIEIAGARKHVISYLEDFLFPPQRARSLVKSLSGGERNRLLLARLFSRPTNVLVLDEPTNDLDIESLELLESLLLEYSGTVLLVSHDRAFLDNVVTQVIAFEGEGHLQEYAGGYEDWLRARPSSKPAQNASTEAPKVKTPATKPQVKLSYKEARELESLPATIKNLETEQASLAEKLNDSELYRSNPEEVNRLQQHFEEIDELLLAALTRWEELEAKQNG